MSRQVPEHRPLRPLLPANVVGALETTAPATPPPKRPSVAAACEACRSRKSKCSGGRPKCKKCLERSTECLYTASVDETRSQALKRKYHELQQQHDEISPHEELFELIKSMSAEEAQGIFRRIKAGHDVRAILSHVRDGNLLLQLHLIPETRLRYEFPYSPRMPSFLGQGNDNPYLGSLVYEFAWADVSSASRQPQAVAGTPDLSPYLKPFHAAVLVEPLLSDIKISDWTSVSSDEPLLNRLMHQYLMHQYSYWPFFHKDYFLQDLKFGRKKFCSSLLVNAILADACHGLTVVQHRNEPWNPSNLGYQFLSEARRLCELEAGKTKITTVQALLVLQLTINVDGFDKIGRTYLSAAVTMSDKMNLFTAKVKDKKLQRVRELTAWAVFTFQALFTFHFFRSPLAPDPPHFMPPSPELDPDWYSELYIRYPGSEVVVPTRHPQVFHAMCQFRIIVNEISEKWFGKQKQGMSLATTIQFYKRLQEWLDMLPTCLTARNIVSPAQLRLHMAHHNTIMCIFEPHVELDDSEAVRSMPLTTPGPNQTPRQIIAKAGVQLETVVRLYYLRHGFETYDPILIHYLGVFGFLSVGYLPFNSKFPERLEATYSSVILAAKGVRDQGRSCHLARMISRLVYDLLGPEHTWLWEEGVQAEEAQRDDVQIFQHARSSYVFNSMSVTDDEEEKGLDNLIKGIAVTNLDDSSDTNTLSRDATPT